MHSSSQAAQLEMYGNPGVQAHTMTCRIVHSLRGRLRVRIPELIHMKELTGCAAYHLSCVQGVREVRSNYPCGSITIHYHPEMTKEQELTKTIGHTRMTDLLLIQQQNPSLIKGVSPKTRRRLRWSVACVILTIVFSGTLFPVRILLVMMIIFISMPIYQQAWETLFQKRKFDLDLLNAFAMTLGLLADDLVVTAIMALLIYLGDYVNELIAAGSNRTLCMLMGDESHEGGFPSPANRQLRLITGLGTLALGIILLPLPGPGLVIIPMGLGMLARERAWAKRLDTWFRERFKPALPAPGDEHGI